MDLEKPQFLLKLALVCTVYVYVFKIQKYSSSYIVCAPMYSYIQSCPSLRLCADIGTHSVNM